MTLRRMKTELVSTGNRNQMCHGCGTSDCRWQMYFPVAIGDDAAGESDFNFRIRLKKSGNGLQRAGQVLFVAVQISEDFAGRATVAAVDGIIHSTVLLDERLHARVVREPVLRAVVGAGVLHDVFQFHALLVGDRRDAELQPLELRKLGVMMENFTVTASLIANPGNPSGGEFGVNAVEKGHQILFRGITGMVHGNRHLGPAIER